MMPRLRHPVASYPTSAYLFAVARGFDKTVVPVYFNYFIGFSEGAQGFEGTQPLIMNSLN
jgi:hypothetical protein